MYSFDPATVRKAVEEFTPRRPQKFQDLLPAKDVIAELRQKRASLHRRSPDAALSADEQDGHRDVLSSSAWGSVRPRKRPSRRKPFVPALSTDETTPLKWTPKLIPAGKLGFARSARCEKEQIDETKTQTV
jgi:hypothetical protein